MGRNANSDVRASNAKVNDILREYHQHSAVNTLLDAFQERGEDVWNTGKTGSTETRESLTLTAYAYTLASMKTHTTQVDEMFRKTVDSATNAVVQDLIDFLKKCEHSEAIDKAKWFREFVKTGQYKTASRRFWEDSPEACYEWMCSNVKGAKAPKIRTMGLLLGDKDAMIFDTNVRTATAHVLKNVMSLYPERIPDCSVCQNAAFYHKDHDNYDVVPKETSHMQVLEPEGYDLEKLCGWEEEYGVWPDMDYFVGVHLTDHVFQDSHFGEYRDIVTNWVRKHTSDDLTDRQVTQLLFNAGMSLNEQKASGNHFDIHAAFYNKV